MIKDTQAPKNDEYFEVSDIHNVDPKKIFTDKYIKNENNIIIDNATKFIGIGYESIKITKNFMNKKDLFLMNKICNHNYKNDKILNKNIEQANNLILEYKEKIKDTAQNLFKIKLEHDDPANRYNLKSNYLNGRVPNFATNIHTDVLTDIENNEKYMWSGHISNLLYLNDNYDGGELYFPKYDLLIKPEAGMLVSFPGNFYNRHGIMPASDFRYAINIFLKISNFPNYLEYK